MSSKQIPTPKGITVTRVYAGNSENDKELREQINEIVFRYRPEKDSEDTELKLQKAVGS